MKTKVKALAAALTLLAAGQANAAINAISDDNAATPGGGTGAGDLFLSVIDRGGSNPESYVLNMGSLGTTDSILSNSSSLSGTSISADANLQALIANQQANGGSLYWNIGGADNLYNSTTVHVGVFSTSPGTLDSSNIPVGQQGLFPVMQTLDSYVKAVNQAPNPNGLQNSVLIPSSNTNAFYDGVNWGAQWLNPGVANTEAAIGSSMGFYFVGLNSTGGTQATALDAGTGAVWTLSSNGTLSFGAAPAPVPLPPAVWLLGSALVGLVGVGRRRGNLPA